MEREIICISCPLGCHLTAAYEAKGNLSDKDIAISGNKCKRGVIYGTEEILSPKRVVTATCSVNSRLMSRIPVKTTGSVPKEMIDSLINELYRLRLTPPVTLGDKIITNFRETGVDVVTTRSLES